MFTICPDVSRLATFFSPLRGAVIFVAQTVSLRGRTKNSTLLAQFRDALMQIISHPEKVLFPDDGITKGELASYYARVAPVMLPHIRRRPVTMERYHRGIGAPGFFQKDVSKGVP